MKLQLVDLGCPEEKINVSPCGPNIKFDLNIELSKNPLHFLTTGRFVDKKAPQLTIKAFNEVRQNYKDVSMTMIADGPLLNECKELSVRLGCSDSIHFPGPVTQEKIVELMQNSFAFLQHSVRAKDGDSEGTPVSILEAMLAGLPVVSTRHAGIKDVIVEEESGLLVDEFDWKEMSVKMASLIENKVKAEEMGARAKTRVKDLFTMEHHLEKVWNTIHSCI